MNHCCKSRHVPGPSSHVVWLTTLWNKIPCICVLKWVSVHLVQTLETYIIIVITFLTLSVFTVTIIIIGGEPEWAPHLQNGLPAFVLIFICCNCTSFHKHVNFPIQQPTFHTRAIILVLTKSAHLHCTFTSWFNLDFTRKRYFTFVYYFNWDLESWLRLLLQ